MSWGDVCRLFCKMSVEMNDSIFCHQYCLWHFSLKWTFRRFVFKVTSFIITNSYSSYRVHHVVQQNSILGLSSHQSNTYYIALHHSFFDPLQLVKLGFARRAAPRATAKQCGHPDWLPCAIGAWGCHWCTGCEWCNGRLPYMPLLRLGIEGVVECIIVKSSLGWSTTYQTYLLMED